MSANGDAALGYARSGIPVFPLHEPRDDKCSCGDALTHKGAGKHPRTPNGIKDATTDETRIREWWARWPDANIGAALGPSVGVVLDIDPRHGGDESLERLVETYGLLPRGWIAATGGGGEHRWFAHPGGNVPIAHPLVPGVDLQPEDTYVVLPPSLHASGKRYEWVVPPGSVKLPLLPPWILTLAEERKAERRPKYEPGPDGKISHGQHHDFIVSTAASFASRIAGISEAELSRMVNATVREVLDDPDRHEQDIKDAVVSAIRRFGRPAPESRSARADTERVSEHGSSANPRGPSPGDGAGTSGAAGPFPGGPKPEAGAAESRAETPAGGWTDLQTVKEVLAVLGAYPPDLFDPVLDPKTGQSIGWKPNFGEFVDWFRTSEHFAVPVARGTFSTPSNFELLRYEGGYYNGRARAFIRGRVEDAFRSVGLASKDGFREEIVRGVANQRESLIERDSLNPPDLLCLSNGILDTRDGRMHPHTPRVGFTWRMPVAYDPAATCPRFARFLEEIQPDPPKRELLVDLMGYVLRRENPWNNFFVLVGDGANGKTTWARVMLALLGGEAVSTLSLQQIAGMRFGAAELEGKLANICDDLPYNQRLPATGVLKVVTGEGDLTVERKHQHPFRMKFEGKLISLANRTPPVEDDSYAFWRRAVVIPFEQVFPEGRRDPFLFEKLEEELPGILNLALRGLARVRSRDRFDHYGAFEDSREAWQTRADPVREFLHTRQTGEGNWTPWEQLYGDYVRWCEDEGETPLKKETLGKRIERVLPLSRRQQKKVSGKYLPGRTWVGPPAPDVGLEDAGTQETLDGPKDHQNPRQPDVGGASSESGPASSGLVGLVSPAGNRPGESMASGSNPTRPDVGPPPGPSGPTSISTPPEPRSDGDDKHPPQAIDRADVDAAFKTLTDELGKRGDIPFEWDRTRGWIAAKAGQNHAVLDVAFARACGLGLVRKIPDGRWRLVVEEKPLANTEVGETLNAIAMAQRERLEAVLETARELSRANAAGDHTADPGGAFRLEDLLAALEGQGIPRVKSEAIFQILRNQGEVYETRTGGWWKLLRF